MGVLFIIGNGFDLAHGIPTRYKDFRKFICQKYPDAYIYRDEVIDLDDFQTVKTDNLSAEILLNTMDKACGHDWNDFEAALAQLNFSDKMPKPMHKENETEEEDNIMMFQYMQYMSLFINRLVVCSREWQDFFRLWIKEIEQDIESKNYAPKPQLQRLFSESNTQFLSFNYTKTLQVLYNIKKVIHIHNRSGQKLIFGHGEEDIMYNGTDKNELCISSSYLDDLVMSFKKDTTSPLRKYKKFFENLNKDISKVYSYGFSYSKVDSVYIKLIINRISPDAIWFFTEFDAQNKEDLRIKKVKLRNYGFKGTFDVYEG